jgi:Na+/H+ antiporter NhaD/arsenite permease-like protein
LWTLSLWRSWLFVNGALVAVYFLADHFIFYPRETTEDVAADEARVRRLTFSGLWPNALLLVGIVFSVALLDPSKPFPGTQWHPWLYLREMVQLALVAVSLLMGPRRVRDANNFDYLAIVEVAALFIGIFIAMQPALEILNARGATLGIDTPQKFFWASGWLSSVLDNAPTYLVFFKTAQTMPSDAAALVGGVAEPLLRGISLGSVMMGAMTYIGNGPNFMVKTIAEKSGVRMPSFFGYMAYSCAVLLPILAVNTFLFLE